MSRVTIMPVEETTAERLAIEQTTAEPAPGSRAAAQVLAELQRWSLPFARGELQDGAGPLAGGERFAVLRAGIRAAGLGHASRSGDLLATDRRARVLGARHQTVREWTFADLGQVTALGNWGGLVLVHPDGETELVVAASPHPPSWRDATGWLKVEGAFAAGRGRLEHWLAELPCRLSTDGGA
jgi:hypothetical protein